MTERVGVLDVVPARMLAFVHAGLMPELVAAIEELDWRAFGPELTWRSATFVPNT
jgi:hypothetical protein